MDSLGVGLLQFLDEIYDARPYVGDVMDDLLPPRLLRSLDRFRVIKDPELNSSSKMTYLSV